MSGISERVPLDTAQGISEEVNPKILKAGQQLIGIGCQILGYLQIGFSADDYKRHFGEAARRVLEFGLRGHQSQG